ncbi:MAG: hypothetical protein ABGY24_06220, partial [bacterium]
MSFEEKVRTRAIRTIGCDSAGGGCEVARLRGSDNDDDDEIPDFETTTCPGRGRLSSAWFLVTWCCCFT